MRASCCVIAVCLLAGCALDENSSEQPATAATPAFYVVGSGGARVGSRTLQPGFGVSIVEEVMLGAQRMGRTRQGRLVAMHELEPARPSTFRGVNLRDGRLDFAWIGPRAAELWEQPEARGKSKAVRKAHVVVSLREARGPLGWTAVDGGWMQNSALRRPARAPRPLQLGAGDPWIDVHLDSQTLVAYEGDQPVFATLVSTGIGKPGSVFATPRGVHAIEIKLLSATMDNLEHTGVTPYSYEDVPHTQYIGRVALHGAFWHDNFGDPVSHGCINVSLADAERLFTFTRPALPRGQTQVNASAAESSVIRVR